MIKIVSVDQIRYLDKQTIASYGISGFHLMDLAGKGLANAILNRVNEYSSPPRILMFAGKGNNGGDVFSASKYLRKQKILHETIAFCKKSSIKGDNLLHFNKLNKSSIYPINFIDDPEKVKNYLSEFSPDIIVDGLIGTGIKSEVKGIVKKIIELINKTNNFVISVDIPSGMNGDTGEGFSVNADLTVTFGCPKIGMFSNTTGQEKCGKIINIDLCFPKALIDKVKTNAYLITSSDISTFIQKKPFTSHKGDFGRPLIFAGSPKYPGALILCAGASLLANAGVITVAALKELRDILLTYHPEVTYNIISGISPVSSYLRNLNKALDFTSLAFGPGLGKSKDTKDSLSIILKIFKDLPLIIDADGLNVLSKNIDLLKKRSSRQSKIILTPHPKEFSRISGISTKSILNNRFKYASITSSKYGVYIILKGYSSIIAAPSGELFVNSTGNASMATAGSGDILTGILASFTGFKNKDLLNAIISSVYIHGLAGDICSKEIGEYGITATDILERIPQAINSFIN